MDMNNLTAADRAKIFAAANKGGFPTCVNGSIGTDAANISLSDYSTQLHINCTHGTQNILVSFDSGVTWFTVFAKTTMTFDFLTCKEFQIKGSGSATTYEIIYTV